MLKRCRLAARAVGKRDACQPLQDTLNRYWWATRTVGDGFYDGNRSVISRYQLGRLTLADLQLHAGAIATRCELETTDHQELLLHAKHGDGRHAMMCLERLCNSGGGGAAAGAELHACHSALALAALGAADEELQNDLTIAALMHAARSHANATGAAGAKQPVPEPTPAPTPPPTTARQSAKRVLDAVRVARRAVSSLEAPAGDEDNALRQLHDVVETRVQALSEAFVDGGGGGGGSDGGGSDGGGSDGNEVRVDAGTGADGERPSSAKTERVRASGPLVGLFVLRTAERSRLLSHSGPALGLSLQSLWHEAPDLRRSLRLHVMVDFLPPALADGQFQPKFLHHKVRIQSSS